MENIKADNFSTKLNIFFSKNRYILILLLLCFALCGLPLSIANVYSGHDFAFHATRIQCIADNISNGKWFSPIYYTHLGGYGYASPLFYGDLFLHLPGFLVYLGMSISKALSLFYIIVTFLTSIITYFCGKIILKNSLSAFVLSVAFTYSSYYAVDMAVRTALGEVQSFMFLPVIVLGIWSIVNSDGKYWLCLPVGLSLLVITHDLTAVMATVGLVVYCLVNAVSIIKNKKPLILISVSAVVFFVLSAFFVFPLTEQLLSYSFPCNNGYSATVWGSLSERALPFYHIFNDFVIRFGAVSPSNDWIPNGIGLSPLVSGVSYVVCKIKKISLGKFVWITGISTLALLIVCTDIFPWSFLEGKLDIVQFPWRILIFATLSAAFFASLIVKNIKNEKYAAIIALSVVFLSIFSYIATASNNYQKMVDNSKKENPYYYTVDYTSVGSGEYIPVYCNESADRYVNHQTVEKYIKNRGSTVTASEGVEFDFEISFAETTATFKNATENSYMEFPYLMYKGYAAEINGNELPVTYGTNGIVRVDLGSYSEGTVKVYYKGTTLWLASRYLSLGGLAGLVIYIVIRRIIRKRSQRNTPFQEVSG